MSVIILEKIKKKEGFILKKTKELKFLKKFRDEIKSVTDQLDDFDKNKELKGDFIEALLDVFRDSEYIFYDLEEEIDIDFKNLFKFLLKKSNKLKLKKDKEFFWIVVNFILFKVINLQELTMDKLSKEFNRYDLINIFDLLEITVEDFSNNLHSFVGDNELIDFGSLVDHQIFYNVNKGVSESYFVWSANPDLNYDSFFSKPGEIVVLDRGLFELSDYGNISSDELTTLHSKFIRLFANSFLHNGGKKSKEFVDSQRWLENDKVLKKCFTETMSRNLSNFSTYEAGELRDTCAMGSIPVYHELLDYLEKSGEDEVVKEARDYIRSVC